MEPLKPLPVVVTWINNWPLTEALLEDVLAQDVPPGYRLVVLLFANGVSQAEDLGARTWMYRSAMQADPQVVLFSPVIRLPLAAAWNRVLEACWSMGAEEALVLNNDLELWTGTLRWLTMFRRDLGALFVTGIGVTQAQFEAFQAQPEVDLQSRGGPDFSCFLIGRECHERFQFDEDFAPAYYEDNDYHRRLILAGEGERIFGVNLPFHHIQGGSGSLRELQRQAEERGEDAKREFGQKWEAQFGRSRQHYLEKWGGLPGGERFETPFGK